jgi:hypothetical protein
MNSKEAIKKIMSVLNLTNETFYEAKTDQGVVVKMEGEALEVGKMLYVATDEGMIPAPPGKHMMEDGSEVEVGEDGKVSKIKMGDMEKTDDAKLEEKKKEIEIADESMAESEEPKIEMEDGDIKLADGSVLRIGGETPEFGVKIKKVGYDGTLSAIADGAYETADGKVMQIVGGEIQGIQSKEAEMARGGKFTEAKSGDLTLDSPTFDVGETIDVVKDGEKTPAPDGEHEVILKDESGNENKIRVVVKDGKITERENVEEAQPESEDEMSAFIEAFTTAMKKMETKLDELANKTTVLEKSFKKFSNEPAGSPIKKQINPESFGSSTNAKLEGFKRLRETISKNN